MEFKIAKDAGEINQAMFKITHGLYILTSKSGEKINGQCLDALMQVTNAPARVAIGVNKRSLTHEMIMESGFFTVNVINKCEDCCVDMIRHYGFQTGRKVDKFANEKYELGNNGAPILSDALAFYECIVDKKITQDLGTHSLFVGTVERAGAKDAGEPLTYNEYRRSIKH